MFGTWSGRPPFKTLTYAYRLATPPAAEPISLVEAKAQCRRATDENVENSQWDIYIGAGRNQAEIDCCRAVCWQRWVLTIDRWPDVFELYKCPVINVETMKYLDLGAGAGTWQTVDPSVYTVSYSEPCRIGQSYGNYWQPNRYQMGSIEVTFTSGYLIPFMADATGNTLTFTDYVPTNGDSFRLSNSGGQLPSPLVVNRTYFIVGSSASTCQLSLTAAGSAIDLTDSGNGLNFLGVLPGGLRLAMLKHIATNFADREGSTAAADCERSYLQSLRSVQYTVM